MIQHIYGIGSLRKTAEEIEMNVVYSWFLGYSMNEKTPHFAIVSYNFRHRFTGETINYEEQLLKEINKDREKHGKKPLEPKDKGNKKDKEVTASKTDPDSGLFHKGEHKKCFAYEAHTTCDSMGYVLGVYVTPGNIYDSVAFDPLFNEYYDCVLCTQNKC